MLGRSEAIVALDIRDADRAMIATLAGDGSCCRDHLN
jgi:hypothetical protein